MDFIQNDYYGALEIDSTASTGDVKKAYRKLSLTYHPDKRDKKDKTKYAEDEERFMQIAEAYDVLRRDDTRKEYDDFLRSVPARYRPKFGKQNVHTVFEGMAIFLTIITFVKHMAQVVMYHETIRRVQNTKSWHMAVKKAAKEGKPPPTLDIRGADYPKWTSLFVVQFLRLPYQIPHFIYTMSGIWRRQIFGGKMTPEEEKRWAMATYHLTEQEYEEAVANRERRMKQYQDKIARKSSMKSSRARR